MNIIELAEQVGFNTDKGMIWVEGWEISPFMQRFARLHRNASLEEAAGVCAERSLLQLDERVMRGIDDCAAAIRAMKEKT